MSEIKTSSTSSDPAVLTEKDFQLARQQAEMKAGEALFREASQKIMEQRDKEVLDNTDEEHKQPKDTAQLSDLRLRPPMGNMASMDEILTWVLEMAGKDWEAFLRWMPAPGMPLPVQLQELSKLYLDLLEAALKHAEGENLARQLEHLDAMLAQKLNALIEKNLESLTVLFKQSGENTVMDRIRSSLYQQTAGRVLSPRAAHDLFSGETASRQGNARTFTAAASSVSSSPSSSSPSSLSSFTGKGTGNPSLIKQDGQLGQSYQRQSSAASSSFSGEGMIYQSTRKQNIRFQQVYHGQKNSWKEQIGQRKEVISNARKGIAENTFRQTASVSCSGKEIEMANRFAAHINGRGNLFQNPDISARNDEIIGLLAAIMSIKGQVYTVEAGRSSFLTLSLQHAIEKIIDHYLSQKGVTNVYYHTLALYKKIRNPQKAIQAGQDYAYQRFREKQKDPACQKSAPYSRESGFFRALLKKLSPEKEFALGTNLLQKDWENFLRTLRKTQKSSSASRAEKYSPWGILLDPGIQHTDSSKNNIKILLGIGVLVLLGILVMVFFRLFLF